MVFLNETGLIGQILEKGTATLTGNMVVTLMIIILIIMAFALMFSIPLEFTAILVYPLIMGYGLQYSEFVTMFVALIFYTALILTPRFLIK